MAGDLAIGGFGFVANVVLVLIYMVFIFAEQAVFRRKILSIAGERHDDAERVLNTIGRGIQRYLGVKTVVSLLTGSLCYLVMVALDIPYALFFGFLTFMFNYIPTFGSIIAGSLPTMTALAVEASWTKAAAIMSTYLAVNLTLGSFIEPRILGRELNLSPLVVVVSVVVWAGLWGVVGGFLAVPLTASLQICLASQESTRPLAVMLGSGPPREKKKSPD
jgi:predicted PurR-regulated permease PerM